MCLSFSICAPFLWIVFCNSHSRSRNWCTVTRYAAWLHAGSSHTLLSKQSATFILVSMLCYRWRFITNWNLGCQGTTQQSEWDLSPCFHDHIFPCQHPLLFFVSTHFLVPRHPCFTYCMSSLNWSNCLERWVWNSNRLSALRFIFFPLLSKSFFYQTDCPSYMMLPSFFKLLRFSGCAYQHPTLPYRGSYGR